MKRASGELAPGTRVYVAAPQRGLRLRSRKGTIIRPVDDDDLYYVIRLDKPALYDRGLGDPPEELPEIVEAVDNLSVLAMPQPAPASVQRPASSSLAADRLQASG